MIFNPEIDWRPQLGPQTTFSGCGVYEALFGGAAGGGKTDALLMEGLRQIEHPDYRAILFRRTHSQLEKVKQRSMKYFPSLGGKWNDGKQFWEFPSTSRYYFKHMEHEKHKFNHDGMEYHYIAFDELTHFTETQYKYLQTRNRSSSPGLRCYIRASGMPVGPGTAWVKDRFIGYDDGEIVIDPETKMRRVFIPSQLDDNKYLMANDPHYQDKLRVLGPKIYKALYEGDWDAIEGACFDELDKSIHMVKPHMPPADTTIWCSFDWGYASPFSVGWYYLNFDNQIVHFAEWYGATKDGKGIAMSPKDVARGILDFEQSRGFKCCYRVGDPAIWQKDTDEPSVGQVMAGLDPGVHFDHAINDRIQGKMEIHGRLRLNEFGKPGVLITEDCVNFWKTIPMLQADPRRPEDVLKCDIDHRYDEFRYSLMSMPLRGISQGIDFGETTDTGEYYNL